MASPQRLYSSSIWLWLLVVVVCGISGGLGCGKGTYDSRMETRIQELRTTATTDDAESEGTGGDAAAEAGASADESQDEVNDDGDEEADGEDTVGGEPANEDTSSEPADDVFAEEDE